MTEPIDVKRGPRYIKNHVVLTKAYRTFYLEKLNAIKPVSLDGVSSHCYTCQSTDRLTYSTKRNITVCPLCQDGDDTIEMDDVKHPWGDLTEWVPILRDSEHNLVLQNKTTKQVGISTILDGKVTYTSLNGDIDTILDKLETLSDAYLDNWSPSTFYNMPIHKLQN